MVILKRTMPRKIPDLQKIKKTANNKRAEKRLSLSLADPCHIPIKDLKAALKGKYDNRPISIPKNDLKSYRGLLASNICNQKTAIHAYCASCVCANNEKTANRRIRECDFVYCELWAFRLGDNPFYNKS